MRLDQDESGTDLFDVLPGARSLFRGRRAARKWLKLIQTTQAYEEMTDPNGLAVAELARVRQPMFAAYGELSARKRSALALQQLCSRCQLHVVPKAGHFFPLTRPSLFARPALAFLRSSLGGTADPVQRLHLHPMAHADLSERPVAEAMP